VSYTIDWDERALGVAARYLGEDQPGLLQLFQAVDELADAPRPPDSREFGSPDRRRLHVGRYRVLYQIRDDLRTVMIAHVGRVP
jgi:mRNA interferase RelE/StbE